MRPTLSRAVIAGFAGTMLVTLGTLFVSPFLRGGSMDLAAIVSDQLSDRWIAGVAIYLGPGGVILPIIYSFAFYPWLAGSPAQRGMSWGLLLWLISQAIVLPAQGDGFFSARTGGPTAAIGSLLGHAVYGLVLGFVAGGAHEPTSGPTRHLGSRFHMRRAG